tara:strand:- start:793 stop:1506 length:714 start_codon:yes stop_codon:yes gene_type:complete
MNKDDKILYKYFTNFRNHKNLKRNILSKYFVSLKKCNRLLKIEAIHKFIITLDNNEIVLLKDKEILMWIYGVLSFLGNVDEMKGMTKTQKQEYLRLKENEWGRGKTGSTNLWSGKFGEIICKELYILQGYTVVRQKKVKEFRLDLYIEELDKYIEVKTGTYFTPGTAWEKIYGIPMKYSDIEKPLLIICLGDVEKRAKSNIINIKNSKRKDMLKYCYDYMDINYVCITQLLEELVDY